MAAEPPPGKTIVDVAAQAVAAEVMGSGVRINAVLPGSVLTPGTEQRITRMMIEAYANGVEEDLAFWLKLVEDAGSERELRARRWIA